MRSVVLAFLSGAVLLAAVVPSVLAVDAVPTALPAAPGFEQEPNESTVRANQILNGQRVRSSVFPATDVDYFRFEGHGGDRVFATTMTRTLGNIDGETELTLLGSDGTTVIESDTENGTFGPSSSSIAGSTIPGDGTYYLKVNHPSASRPVELYDLYLQLRTGRPTPETEPNNVLSSADSLSSGYVSGVHNPSEEKDYYAMQLNAGDTVFLSLDLDPERDETFFDAYLGFGLLGDSRYIAAISDPANPESPTTIPSEAYEITVLKGGTYYVSVTTFFTDEGSSEATYRLSATILPAVKPTCRTYTTTPSAGAIPDDGEIAFPILVATPGSISRAAVGFDLTHTRMSDLDVSLRAPSGSEGLLFSDTGATSPGPADHMLAQFDPYAAFSPPSFMLHSVFLQPEFGSQLDWFSGQPAAGIWNVLIRDDTAGETGSISRIDLIFCTSPDPLPPDPLSPSQIDTAPLLSSLRIAPQRFRAANSEATISRKSKGKNAPVGTTVSYKNSQAALTFFTVLKGVSGHKVQGKCVLTKEVNSGKPRCRRNQRTGRFTHRDVDGRNTLRFSGRVNGKKLAPGKYTLLVTGASPGGKASNRLTRPFTIVP